MQTVFIRHERAKVLRQLSQFLPEGFFFLQENMNGRPERQGENQTGQRETAAPRQTRQPEISRRLPPAAAARKDQNAELRQNDENNQPSAAGDFLALRGRIIARPQPATLAARPTQSDNAGGT